jgi:membrane protease YdiL (CAAX protease family)
VTRQQQRSIHAALLLVAGLSSSLLLRVELAGAGGDAAVPAGLIFSLLLVAVAVASDWRPQAVGWRQVAVGLAGAAGLCLPALLRDGTSGTLAVASWQGFVPWAMPVSVVAASEEVLFRGALYDRVQQAAGDLPAIIVGALLFAATHVVLNGGHALVLDSCVGLWLGAVRMLSGGVAAPATAHLIADLSAWWLR